MAIRFCKARRGKRVCELSGMAIDIKRVHYPKAVVLHAVFFTSVTPCPVETLRRSWLSGASPLITLP